MGFHVTEATCYLTADLFYLEVVLLPCGGVENVKVAPHGGSPVVSAASIDHISPIFGLCDGKLSCLAAQRVLSSAAEVREAKLLFVCLFTTSRVIMMAALLKS